MREFVCDNITAKDGILYFAGQNTVELAKKYGSDESARFINGVLGKVLKEKDAEH